MTKVQLEAEVLGREQKEKFGSVVKIDKTKALDKSMVYDHIKTVRSGIFRLESFPR